MQKALWCGIPKRTAPFVDTGFSLKIGILNSVISNIIVKLTFGYWGIVTGCKP
jgi:hypothetical protein